MSSSYCSEYLIYVIAGSLNTFYDYSYYYRSFNRSMFLSLILSASRSSLGFTEKKSLTFICFDDWYSYSSCLWCLAISNGDGRLTLVCVIELGPKYPSGLNVVLSLTSEAPSIAFLRALLMVLILIAVLVQWAARLSCSQSISYFWSCWRARSSLNFLSSSTTRCFSRSDS